MNDEAPPPGRAIRYLDQDQLQLVLYAVEGMAQHLRGESQRRRAGSPAYHAIGDAIGHYVTIANQIRRQLDQPADA